MSKGWAISNLTVKLSWRQFIGRYVAQPHVWRCKADFLDHASREGDAPHWLYSCDNYFPSRKKCKREQWATAVGIETGEVSQLGVVVDEHLTVTTSHSYLRKCGEELPYTLTPGRQFKLVRALLTENHVILPTHSPLYPKTFCKFIFLSENRFCRYTCFNQRARVSLYCNTYALSVGGCLVLVFSAAALTVYTRDSHWSCALCT
jgi:hypothetical protein